MVEAAPLMRLFFALALPVEVRAELAAFQARARAVAKGSWPAPENLHLTLAFLGDQPEGALPRLMEVGQRVAAGHGVLHLRTAGLGGFPRASRARVLWLGLEAEPRLQLLAARLREGLRHEGFDPDDKPFTAHLTLARLATPTDIAAFGAGPQGMGFEARELTLFRSHLGSGAHYEKLGVFPF